MIPKYGMYAKYHTVYDYCYPRLVCELVKIFGTSFYGSQLWLLASDDHYKLIRSWNTTVKMIWELPFSTHKRFVESLTDVPHLENTLHSNYVGFINKLMSSEKSQVKVLCSHVKYNQTTKTGQNLYYLMQKYNKNDIEDLIQSKYAIKKTRIHELLEDEEWKPNMLEELSLAKKGLIELDLAEDEIDDLIEAIATT